MTGSIAAYAVAVGAMLFAAASAITLIYVVSHLDAPDRGAPRAEARREAAGV